MFALAGGPTDSGGDAGAGTPTGVADKGEIRGLLDSGAFSDAPQDRLSPEEALPRQLSWEEKACSKWGIEYVSEAVVSYDRLIDEKWTDGVRRKERWSIGEAEAAVEETIEGTRYLASMRGEISPRKVVLAAQGVQRQQYVECASEILRISRPEDWLGLGGWCILGLYKSWLPEFGATIAEVLPMAARAGIGRVHLFGVLYPKALGILLWKADKWGISVSTDSSAPVMAATQSDARKAGMRGTDWRSNVALWKEELRALRGSSHYREPVDQPTLF